MIVHVDPCTEGSIEIIEAHGILGTDLGFKSVLGGLEQPLNETAWGRVSGGPVAKSDVEPVAGGFEAGCMIDLGVIEVELGGGSPTRT